MYCIRNKVSRLFFVGDALCWTSVFEFARFYEHSYEALNHLYKILPNIDKNTCEVLLIDYKPIDIGYQFELVKV